MESTRILYVEDEPFLAKIVQESLESRGFEVTLEADGEGALEAFRRVKPHLCVLDVMLPRKDGFELAKEIRQLTPEIPIIFLTARVQVEDVLKGFDAGGNDYLRKPFSMEELIVRIRNLLRFASNHPKTGPEDGTRRLGNSVYSPLNYTLQSDGNERKLSHRENMILQMLTDDPSHPVKRRDILLNIWGDDSFYNSRNLDVYIARIRDFFSGDPSVEIVTIKGVGYHFIIK
jgi:DNA-binding response OmpR family regulator